MNSDVLSMQHDGHVATLWLDRPEARNAMGPAFWSDLPVAMAELSDDPDVRAVVIAAKGPHFSVGLDLKAMGAMLSGDGGSESRHSRAATAASALQSIQSHAGLDLLGRRLPEARDRGRARVLHRRRGRPDHGV